MHVHEQLVALEEGRIDVGLTRPLEPPFDRNLQSELLYRDPIVVAIRPDHPFAKRVVHISELQKERIVVCDQRHSPVLMENFVKLCGEEGFSPNIVNSSPTWAGVLTLVEAGEGIGIVPSAWPTARSSRTSFLSDCP
jgi:DNA-binding transcriptional LysR family regulator